MELTLPIPDTIGSASGSKLDGALVGEVSHLTLDAISERRFANAMTALLREEGNTYTDLTTNLNNTAVNVELFTTSAVTDDAFYFVIDSDINEVHFNMAVAGVGSFVVAAEYNGPGDSWEALPNVTNEQFLKSSGRQVVTFDTPGDWEEDYVGPYATREKWIRFRITSGTVSTAPEASSAYKLHATASSSDVTSNLSNLSLFDPSDFIVADDELALTSQYLPFGLEVIYETAQSGGSVSLTYGKNDSTYPAVSGVEDTSSGLTTTNSITHQHGALSATSGSATIATVQGIEGDGYVACTPDTDPGASSDRFTFGLSTSTTGTIDYELAVNYAGGAPQLEVLEGGVSKFTTATFDNTHELRVFRFEEKIYYVDNGQVIYTSAATDVDDLFYGRFTGTDNGVVINSTKLVDFSGRRAFPRALTWQDNTDFSVGIEAPAAAEYLARHFFMFETPSDIEDKDAGDTKTGTAGYELCLKQSADATSDAQIMLARVLTVDAPSNEFVDLNKNKIMSRFNLEIAEIQNFTSDADFLVIIPSSKSVRKVTVSAGGNELGSDISTAISGTNLHIHQIGSSVSEESLTAGSPSYILIGE